MVFETSGRAEGGGDCEQTDAPEPGGETDSGPVTPDQTGEGSHPREPEVEGAAVPGETQEGVRRRPQCRSGQLLICVLKYIYNIQGSI